MRGTIYPGSVFLHEELVLTCMLWIHSLPPPCFELRVPHSGTYNPPTCVASTLPVVIQPQAHGPDMRVCLTLGFFGMLRQSNLAPHSPSQFNQNAPVHRYGISLTHSGGAGASNRSCNAFHQFLADSPSSNPDHPLLTYTQRAHSWSWLRFPCLPELWPSC